MVSVSTEISLQYQYVSFPSVIVPCQMVNSLSSYYFFVHLYHLYSTINLQFGQKGFVKIHLWILLEVGEGKRFRCIPEMGERDGRREKHLWGLGVKRLFWQGRGLKRSRYLCKSQVSEQDLGKMKQNPATLGDGQNRKSFFSDLYSINFILSFWGAWDRDKICVSSRGRELQFWHAFLADHYHSEIVQTRSIHFAWFSV